MLAFVDDRRTATLATLAADGRQRLVPICFVLAAGGAGLYTPIDRKPKRSRDWRDLARVRDIAAHADVTLLFEHWSEDWSELAWIRVYGRATILEPGTEPVAVRAAIEALRTKYPQYRDHDLERSPMIRVDFERSSPWSAAERF